MSLLPPSTVGKLQGMLRAKAKESPSYRFYALYDKVYRDGRSVLAYARAAAIAGRRAWTGRRSRTSRRTGGSSGWANWPKN